MGTWVLLGFLSIQQALITVASYLIIPQYLVHSRIARCCSLIKLIQCHDFLESVQLYLIKAIVFLPPLGSQVLFVLKAMYNERFWHPQDFMELVNVFSEGLFKEGFSAADFSFRRVENCLNRTDKLTVPMLACFCILERKTIPGGAGMFEPWMQLEYEDSPGAVDYEPRKMIGCSNLWTRDYMNILASIKYAKLPDYI